MGVYNKKTLYLETASQHGVHEVSQWQTQIWRMRVTSILDPFSDYWRLANPWLHIEALIEQMDPLRAARSAIRGTLDRTSSAHWAFEEAKKHGYDHFSDLLGVDVSAEELIRSMSTRGSAVSAATEAFNAEHLIREEAHKLGIAGIAGYSHSAAMLGELPKGAFGGSTLDMLNLEVSAAQQAFAGISPTSTATELALESLLASWGESTWLTRLQRESLGPQSIEELMRVYSPGLAAFEAAKMSFDMAMHGLANLGWDSGTEDSGTKHAEPRKHIGRIAASVKEQTSFQGALTQIFAHTAWLSPKVRDQVRSRLVTVLWFLFKCALAAVATYEITEVWKDIRPGKSRQEITKQVENAARRAAPSPFLLDGLRYVNTQGLQVRLNPRARSPEQGKLQFGNVVHILKQDRDFTLIAWQTEQGDTELQGWVFSRYLKKFT